MPFNSDNKNNKSDKEEKGGDHLYDQSINDSPDKKRQKYEPTSQNEDIFHCSTSQPISTSKSDEIVPTWVEG
jgi:hypothetical protein